MQRNKAGSIVVIVKDSLTMLRADIVLMVDTV